MLLLLLPDPLARPVSKVRCGRPVQGARSRSRRAGYRAARRWLFHACRELLGLAGMLGILVTLWWALSLIPGYGWN